MTEIDMARRVDFFVLDVTSGPSSDRSDDPTVEKNSSNKKRDMTTKMPILFSNHYHHHRSAAERRISIEGGHLKSTPPPLMNNKGILMYGTHPLKTTPSINLVAKDSSCLINKILMHSARENSVCDSTIKRKKKKRQLRKRIRSRSKKVKGTEREPAEIKTDNDSIALVDMEVDHMDNGFEPGCEANVDEQAEDEDSGSMPELSPPHIPNLNRYPTRSRLDFDDQCSDDSFSMPVLFPSILLAESMLPSTTPILHRRCALTSSKNGKSETDERVRTLSETTKHKETNSTPKISLRGYYYGRWNWSEEANDHRIARKSRKQHKRTQFETDFSRYRRSEMETSVHCRLCPKEILSNANVVCHIIKEHISENKDGNWELIKHRTIPKSSNSNSDCRLCFTSCTSLSRLNTHMRQIHQHTTDICCRICEVGFDSTEKMTLHHSKFHHVAEMPYSCPVCDCRSSFRWDLIKHFQLKHGHDSRVLCPYCMRLFNVSVSIGMIILQEHLLEHHAEPELKCPRCCLRFVNTEDLNHHLFHHHHPPKEMHGNTFYDKLKGFQCFKEEEKQNPMFINHPHRGRPQPLKN
ncbi:uncharacterized protein LOC110847915 isoform X3 [Folsomia candida]|uniref:uncharacterized protein LOC110847915 isoform X3 n=1 Tax=Folsomia candida TaxID=158441 RepID=UPI000B8FC380|nr:uncharacterized protein LOC110847915 isoform X3 [Folsomia candida]